jgi:DNA-directed RNA polymerase subunit L
MKEWLFYQVEHFNALMLFVMIIFVTAMSKANTQKLLKEQSQEIYNEVEEIKSEIWRASPKSKD